MPASIAEIARLAGVSSSTVARVLRGDVKGAQKRSAEKAAHILKLSRDLGCQPDWRARALSRGKTHTIGLLYSEPKWIFADPMNETAIAFTQALQEHNYDLRLIPATTEEHWKPLVLGGAVDGLALLHHTPPGTERAIVESGLPVIALNDRSWSDHAGISVPSVVPDDVGGAYLATRHLLSQGHRRLAYYVDRGHRPHFSIGERLKGFTAAIDAARTGAVGEAWQIDAEEAVERLLSADRPTAILAYCQDEALHVMHAAWVHGLRIPADLSLVAFNDMAITARMTPPLTVVGYSFAEMGRRGAKMLVQQIDEAEQDGQDGVVLLRERLVVRNTTAAPPAVRSEGVA